MSARDFWFAFGIGAAAGAAVALLYAPSSGENTRKKLSKAYDEATDYMEDASDYLKDQADRLAKQSQKLYGQGKDAASDAYDSASDVYKSASKTYSKTSDRLADAFSVAKDKAEDFGSYTAAYGKKIRSMV